MRLARRMIVVAFVLPLLLVNGRPAAKSAPSGTGNRIIFQLTMAEENAGRRTVVSSAKIEGPPGTDFSINLSDGRFKMEARFLTDLQAVSALKVRARLHTRRLYGYSERQLPLYEEDDQSHDLAVGLDETIVLLPFGSGGGDTFKIEIVPSLSDRPAYSPAGEAAPPEIAIDTRQLSGLLTIQACKVPHLFEAQGTLLENGREIAHGQWPLHLEESGELTLEPTRGVAFSVPLRLRMTISDFIQSRPSDRATLTFDVYKTNGPEPAARTLVAAGWAGVTDFSSPLTYDLSRALSAPSGKKYELKLSIKQ